jgi:hypothetical protein
MQWSDGDNGWIDAGQELVRIFSRHVLHGSTYLDMYPIHRRSSRGPSTNAQDDLLGAADESTWVEGLECIAKDNTDQRAAG